MQHEAQSVLFECIPYDLQALPSAETYQWCVNVQIAHIIYFWKNVITSPLIFLNINFVKYFLLGNEFITLSFLIRKRINQVKKAAKFINKKKLSVWKKKLNK